MRSKKDNHILGVLFSLIGVMVYANDTLLISISGAPGVVAGFWRGFFAFAVLSFFIPIIYKKKTLETMREGGMNMILSGFLYGSAGTVYAISVSKIGGSICLIILSTAPLITAILAYFFFNEKSTISTVVTMIICFIVVFFMFIGNKADVFSWKYFLVTFYVPFALSLNLLNLRKHPEIPQVGVSFIGGLVTATICCLLSKGNIYLPFPNMKYLVLLGGFVIPFGQIMIMKGTLYIKASEVSLINSLECVFGLIYVWLFLGERPSTRILIGGIVIICAVTLNILIQVFAKDIRYQNE